MGTKKSNKLYAAAAALAVTASAVAPGLTADAASKVTVKSVTNPASISHYGGYTFAVKKLSLPKTVKVLLSNKKYENRSVKWGKVSYDKKYIGKYQTISGTVSGTTKKASIKVKLNNYPVDVVEPKLAPVAVGEKLNLPSTIDVKYKDGKVIARSAKSFNLTAEKTDKAGMMKLSYNYMGKNSSIKGSIAYEVKAAEITNVMNEIKDDMLSVSADVKYPAKDAKVEVLVYAFKDMTKEPIKVAAELKDGKLTAKSGVLPAGTHAFAVKVGEVVSPAKDFVIEAPMVKEVKAINATQVLVKFNKELDKATAETEANYKVNNEAVAAPAVAELQEDKKSVVITLEESKNKTSFTFGVEGVKTVDLKSVESFTSTVAVDDVTNPEVKSVSIASNGNLEIAFSEPLKNINPIVRVGGQPVVITAVNSGDTKVVVPAANYTIASGATASVYVAGAQDTVGNEMNLFNGSVTKVADSTKPTISSIKQVGQNTLRVVFSETLGANDLAVGELKFLKGAALLNSTGVTKNTDVDSSGKTYDVSFAASDIYGATPTDSATVTLLLAKDAVADLAGNTIDQYSQSFTFNADKTGPSFVSSAVSTDKQTIEVKFDEDFQATAANIDEGKIIVTDSNGVRYPAIDATTVAKATDSKVLLVDFVAGVGMIPNGTYTVQLQAGAVKDALNNLSSAATTTVVVGDAADKVKPVATLDTTAADAPISGVNKFVVDFSEEVTSATALKLSNYKLDGAALPTGTVIYFNSTDKNSVTIELPESSVKIGSSTLGTDAVLNVSGVEDKAGNASDSTNLTVKIGDNTPAELTSAQKLGNTLVLTFNEDLASNAADADLEEILANYEIKSGTNVVVDGTGVAKAELVAGSANKVQITFSTVGDSLYNATETITVKTKSTGDVTDKNGVHIKGNISVTAN